MQSKSLHLAVNFFHESLQVMEFLLATQELCEMNYPADTVEVALVYTNTEKAKVWVPVCCCS